MTETVTAAFGVTEADLIGQGWESTIYALGQTQILRIPRPDVVSEAKLRAQAALLAKLPPLPFAVTTIREIGRIEGKLYVIEDRIGGQSMATLLRTLSGEKRKTAFQAYLAAAAAMAAVTAPGEAYGDLLSDNPRRSESWSDYLTARVREAAKDEVLAAAVPGLDGIVARYIARLEEIPDPPKCIVHGDIYPANVMMNDDLQVTGLIDFSFTTRVGDHLMDLAGACYYLNAYDLTAKADLDHVKALILAEYGAEATERIGLYGVWFAFDFAYNHDAPDVFAWCTKLIRDFGET